MANLHGHHNHPHNIPHLSSHCPCQVVNLCCDLGGHAFLFDLDGHACDHRLSYVCHDLCHGRDLCHGLFSYPCCKQITIPILRT